MSRLRLACLVLLTASSASFAAGDDVARARESNALVKQGERLGGVDRGAPARPPPLTGAKAALQSGGSIDVEGASGKLDFDPLTGEAPSPIELWQVRPDASGFLTVRTVEPP